MSVRIRLTRVGATGQPSYRVVATDRRRARDGRSLETLGHYNPRTEPMTLVLDLPKVDAWISKGALPSEVVGKLIAKARAGGLHAGGKTGAKAAERATPPLALVQLLKRRPLSLRPHQRLPQKLHQRLQLNLLRRPLPRLQRKRRPMLLLMQLQ